MSIQEEKKPVIQASMLGGFSLTAGECRISDEENRSKKLWSLLAYLIINRFKDVSVNELLQAVWQEDVQDNPRGALKTLVFRVRKMLEKAGFPAQELLLGQRGAYLWNPAWATRLDIDEFRRLCDRCLSNTPGGEEEGFRAFELYKGDFLSRMSEEAWVTPICAYYHSLYRRLVVRLAKYELERENYDRLFKLAERAAGIDPFSEEFHYYRILALYKKGAEEEAVKEYKKVTELFYRERLMTPSEQFKDLYREIVSASQEVITDLDLIRQTLGTPGEGHRENGAYLCEYSVFKRILQLERRRVERSGNSVYLCLLTVGDRRGNTLKPEIQTRAMERLREAIRQSLRLSDVYSRCSVSQYILLLPSATYENGERVMKRILSAFNKAYARKDVAVEASLNPVLPRT